MLIFKSVRNLRYVINCNSNIFRGYEGREMSCKKRFYYSNCSSFNVSYCFSNLKNSNNNMSKPFQGGVNFMNYDCVGFDLDNTLCQYKVSNMMKLEYDVISNYLVNEKGYSKDHLLRPMEENEDFLLKGLVLDLKHGNILKIASDGEILHASHGTRQMSLEDIKKCYGDNCHWEVTDLFCKDPLITWNGPLSEEMRSLLDYFDMPSGLAFARAVDCIDEKTGKVLGNYQIWPDILDGLIDMYDRSQFQKNKGEYFPSMKATPQLYINKCDDEVKRWLKELKSHKKIIFLITGSYVDFASLTASTSLGENWKEIFDIVIFFAKKPGFFTSSRPFLLLDNEIEVKPCAELETGVFYSQGNWNDLYKFLSKASGKSNPKVVYIGDNLIQDVYTPAVHNNIDTVAIVEELLAEGMFGFPVAHSDKNLLTSKHWGSFFTHSTKEADSIWKHIINRHSKLCVPTVHHIACHPVNYTFPKQI